MEVEQSKTCIIDNETGICLSRFEIDSLKKFFVSFFIKQGINVEDKICLFSQNNAYWLMFEMAIHNAGAIAVLRGSDSPISELKYIYSDSDSVAIVTDKKAVVDNFRNYEKLKFIIYFGNEQIEKADNIYFFEEFNINQLQSDDVEQKICEVASILYTSGTSGNPKGVVLSHKNFDYLLNELKNRMPISNKTTISVHPIWHSGPRLYNYFFYNSGCKIVYTEFKNYIDTIKKYKPDYLHCVPRVLQVLYKHFNDEIKKKNLYFQLLFSFLYNVSFLYRKAYRYKKKGYAHTEFFLRLLCKVVTFFFALPHKFISKYVYKPLLNEIYSKTDIVFITGAAVIPQKLLDFFYTLNMEVVSGYGLTEAGPMVSHDYLYDSQFYSSGKPLNETLVKIIDAKSKEELGCERIGLIYVKGPQLMSGYYKKDTNFEDDGYFNTNDIGFVSKEGYLTVLGRHDDVAVLLNGLNVELLSLELECKNIDEIKDIVIVGDGKPFLVAIVDIEDNIRNSLKSSGKKVNDEEFKISLLETLNKVISSRSIYKKEEKIKAIYIAKQSFTSHKDFYTQTMKLRRKAVYEYYERKINKMYAKLAE